MKKRVRIIALVACIILIAGCIPVAAASTPYQTYTYSYEGDTLPSPAAYVPDRTVTNYEMKIPLALNAPKDVFVSDDGNVYIADTGNKRVLVLDSDYVFRFEISSFVNSQGVPDSLLSPQGVFVSDEFIYVCDTTNARIVVFKLDGTFSTIINAPQADVMGTDTLFRPVGIAVDQSGRMYIASKSTYSGIFAINDDGTFQGFIGVQKAEVPLMTRIRKMIFKKIIAEEYISTEYNNIAIDDGGFVWVTSNSQDEQTLENAILNNDPAYAPVKRLNSQGDDIMVRNGFFMPAGEINFNTSAMVSGSTDMIYGPSSIIDVAIGDGVWSIIDSKRSRIFTYDMKGNLLYAFGDVGSQLGNLKAPSAISYKGSDIIVLDSTMNSLTVYKRTEYGDVISNAIKNDEQRDYNASFDSWSEILKRNNNFDAAYIGIGDSLFRQGNFQEAMKMYKSANDTTDYSKAYKEVRKAWMEKYILLIPVIILILVFALSRFFKFAGKINKAGDIKLGRRSFGEEILFGFRLIFHPFDAFWDLKHEKRGSVRGGFFFLGLACLTLVYKSFGTAYIFNPYAQHTNLFYQISTVLIPVLLWTAANWCLTTLFDGEGTLKDIFISTTYSLVPLPLIIIPTTIYTNFATLDEQELITLLTTIAIIWMGGLIFFGSMVTHGYSMGKNFAMTIFSIIGMLFIMFIILLFSNLVQRMASFIRDIITEISYRAQ